MTLKARLLKHAGDLVAAADCMDQVRWGVLVWVFADDSLYNIQARKMDLSDRYLNNKAIKYLLRASKPEQAVALANLFVRTDDKSTPLVLAEIHEMQCLWFEYESGAAALKRGNVIGWCLP